MNIKENELISQNFIKNIIIDDLNQKKNTGIVTRFPPEPNGYLHIGHAKSICLNFGLAEEFSGQCFLRFDDTNPTKEEEEFVHAIIDDVHWLGFEWSDITYASDYYQQLYDFAVLLIKEGKAYVDSLSADDIRAHRGTLTEPGRASPYRDRSIAENLDLFARMKVGEFADGTHVLRARIDMASPNLNMRDPTLYRIRHAHHQRTGDAWCIYPMYDYTHCISDALEGITHSCCSLEFEDHRPLYDWIVARLVDAKLIPCHPQQIEFSRLELLYTVTSKRKLNQLVVEGLVSGWDDPRMPTLSGMRRRGYTADGIKLFVGRCGVSKSPNIVDIDFLESAIREDLENKAMRVMAVLNPVKIVLTNFDNNTASRSAPFHPQHPEFGERMVKLTREIYIERDDFMEIPIEKWQRLAPNAEVRLRHSYVIKCNQIIKDENGAVVELHCSIDHETLGKNPEGRKVKGVIHWVSACEAITAQVRVYDKLFTESHPDGGDCDFKQYINPDSLQVLDAYIESSLVKVAPETHYQFERLGYYVIDRYDSSDKRLVFNKTVGLRDNWRDKK